MQLVNFIKRLIGIEQPNDDLRTVLDSNFYLTYSETIKEEMEQQDELLADEFRRIDKRMKKMEAEQIADECEIAATTAREIAIKQYDEIRKHEFELACHRINNAIKRAAKMGKFSACMKVGDDVGIKADIEFAVLQRVIDHYSSLSYVLEYKAYSNTSYPNSGFLTVRW